MKKNKKLRLFGILLLIGALNVIYLNDNFPKDINNITLNNIILSAKADTEGQLPPCNAPVLEGPFRNYVDEFLSICYDRNGYSCGVSTHCEPHLGGVCTGFMCAVEI